MQRQNAYSGKITAITGTRTEIAGTDRERQQRKRKRTAKRIRRYIRHYGKLILLMALMIGLIAAAVRGIAKEVQKHSEAVAAKEAQTEQKNSYMNTYGCDLKEKAPYPWNTITVDEIGDISGFCYHDLTEEAAAAGGEAPVVGQVYLYKICKKYDVDYETMYALIELSSSWRYDLETGGGESIGLMQISPEWHTEAIGDLHADDLKDPYANMTVGVRYFAELQKRTGNRTDAIAAYRYGMDGARLKLWINGKHEDKFVQSVKDRAQQLKNEKAKKIDEVTKG